MRRSTDSTKKTLAAAIAVVLVTAMVALADHRSSAEVSTTKPVFGVLQADPRWLPADTAAGLRLAMVNVFWKAWEPNTGQFDQRYANSVRRTVARYRSAGWQVAIDIGLQSPPSWVLQLPSGRLTDQHGKQSNVPDFEFSQAVRQAAARYLSTVVTTLGPVQYYRVGLSGHGEAKYPNVTGNGWWAFEPSAQGHGAGLPEGVPVTPMPGWAPGAREYRGRSVRTSQVRAWYQWYFGALANSLAWEISAYRSAGYHGDLELVMPGTGAMPALYQYRINHHLAPAPSSDSYGTLNSGSVWWKLLDELPDLRGVVVDVSSVDDQSGVPRGNGCRPSDTKVDYRDDPSVETWSDTRWLSYLAHLHHLPVMGENPGETPASDLPRIMSLVRSCGLIALQWAFEPELHGGSYTSLAQLGAAISRYRQGVAP